MKKKENLQLEEKLLVVDDLIEELTLYSRSNLAQVRFDILNALSTTEGTLQSFAEIFSDGLAKTFQRTYDKHSKNPESEQLLAKYCSLLLAVPDWSQKRLQRIDLDLCKGVGLISQWHGHAGEGGEIFGFQFDRDAFHRPFKERACHFRRFLRKEKFYQSYKNTGVDV